jgi:hypothetical protein
MSVSKLHHLLVKKGYSELFFKPVSDEFVEKQINNINIIKATGIDQNPLKYLR